MSTSCAARRLTGRVVGAETAAVSQSDGVVVGDRLGVSYKKFQLEALLNHFCFFAPLIDQIDNALQRSQLNHICFSAQ